MLKLRQSAGMLFYYPLPLPLAAAFSGMVLWFIFQRNWKDKKDWRRLNGVLALLSLALICFYTVYGREPGERHRLMFFASSSPEFYREMLMNILLFYPFGLSCSVLLGKRSIPLAFLLSFGIETWQYFAGTGVAQGTDVICNTLGCAIGALPVLAGNKWPENPLS